MKTTNSLFLHSARALALLLGLGVLSYLVYCAHRDARQPEPKREAYLPSSKAIIPPPIGPNGNPEDLDKKKLQKKKKNSPQQKGSPGPKKDFYIPSSKSGVLRLLAPNWFDHSS